MKKLSKILFGLFIVNLLLFATVFTVRWINSFRYNEYISSEEENIYNDPTDFSQYDTEVEGINIEIIEEDLLNGFHLTPKEIKTNGVIVTFGGSEGSSNYDLAKKLAEEGYEVYSLFFFGLGDLPDELIEVPLELFEEFLAYHSKNSQTDGPITVLGASKGAELTLNLATQYSQIDNVVLYAPSAYNFFSLDQANMNKSSWSYEGLSVPYLSNRNGNWQETVKMIGGFIFYYPVKYVSVYDSVIDGTEKTDLERARIKIENFEGNGLIFIGGDDLMWPTQSMTTNVMEEYTEQMEVHFFPEAGHLFPMDRYMGTSGALIAFGGNKNINKQALEESNKILFERLSQWHGNNE